MLHQESEADPVVMLKRSAKSRVVGPDASSTFALALTHTPGGLASPLPLLFACTVVNVHALALPPVRSRSNVCMYKQPPVEPPIWLRCHTLTGSQPITPVPNRIGQTTAFNIVGATPPSLKRSQRMADAVAREAASLAPNAGGALAYRLFV